MRKFPAPIHAAVAALGKLPGVGPKTALRYAFFLLKLPKEELDVFVSSVRSLSHVTRCTTCFTFAERSPCDICSDPLRSETQLCVVAEARDISTLEATGAYRGKYFVLGGVLNPIDGQTPETLNVRALLERLKSSQQISEVVLAFSPDVHGETTILYLGRLIKKETSRKTTRLARGLPMGADIEYADEVTLGSAMQGRSEV